MACRWPRSVGGVMSWCAVCWCKPKATPDSYSASTRAKRERKELNQKAQEHPARESTAGKLLMRKH